MERIEYVLRLQGLADPDVATACHTALRLVAEEMVTAETDIPWGVRERWPLEVVEAAGRLCDRFVHEGDRDDQYMQTGVRSVADRDVREDFIAFAPMPMTRPSGGLAAGKSQACLTRARHP